MEYEKDPCREQLSSALSKSVSLGERIAVYGAGGIAEMSAGTCFTPEAGLNPAYFIDDTPEKHGTLFCGRPIINLEEARSLCEGFQIMLCCGSSRVRSTMGRSLRERPIKGVVFCTLDEYIFCGHAGEILAVYDMLEDRVSKETYANMILTRMGKADLKFVHTDEYFGIPAFAAADPQEVFVDFGAFTGDTLQKYLRSRAGVFQKIYAFEPFEQNFEKLKENVEQLKREWSVTDGQIELVPAAVSDRTGRVLVKYRHEEIPTRYCLCGAEDSGQGTLTYSIDDYFAGQPVSFLKADIQGLEWNMLIGGETVIKRDRPKLAVCIYHTPCDMYRIALKIKEFCPDYRLAVRQYQDDVYDTVLYAY